ncbi:hypothetical protein E4U54_004252 [Claviceps lovelessii]|nr:hypothetical protein E4U54_004252 [Claviceps lovelessii]
MPVQDICPHGYQYYSCHNNDFNGCCSVNPCSLPGCPHSFLPDGHQEDAKTSADTESLTATATTTSPSSTKTDSGVTHTIPNNSVVTITRHTVVFSEAPPSTESSSGTGDGHTTLDETAASASTSASTDSCSACTPTPTFTGSPASTDASSEGRFPTGAIAGAATGGAVIVIIVLIWVFVSRNRKKKKKKRGTYDASETETLGCGDSRVNGSEKANPDAGSGRAGYLRPSSDPFAPFGGRVDQPELHRPPSGTFEMDGAGIPAVELPAMSISEAPDTARKVEADSGMALTPATDPAATLAARPSDAQGKITYVNQWNQYKAMAAGQPCE